MGKPRGLALRDAPPHAESVTDYDLAFANHYLRLLAAHEEGAHWAEAASLVLSLDCDADRERAQAVHAAHLHRAIWISRCGYMDLLKRGLCDEPPKPATG
jgi:hypothetical protein